MKNIIMILLILGISTKGMAQTPSPEQRRSQKIAFITAKLDLTTTEAENFWPIYNEAEAERKTLMKEHRAARSERKISEMTDSEVEKLINEGLDFQQKELELRKKYLEKFKEALPIKKIAKLIHLEHEFRKSHKSKSNSSSARKE